MPEGAITAAREDLEAAIGVLQGVAGSRAAAKRVLGTWRLFLISTEQVWAFNDGNDWMVSHYLLEPRG